MWHPAESKVAETKIPESKIAESKVDEPKVAASVRPKPAVGLGLATEQATLGATITVKGEMSGSQALYIDGRVEGGIHFPGHRVTVGRTGIVLANIEAKEVVIMGSVTGNLDCNDRVDIRSDATLTGDVVTRRISIDEGALVKGSVEVFRGGVREKPVEEAAVKKPEPVAGVSASKAEGPAKAETPAKPDAPTPAAVPAEAPKAAAAAATGTRTASRVAGSSVLYVENKG